MTNIAHASLWSSFLELIDILQCGRNSSSIHLTSACQVDSQSRQIIQQGRRCVEMCASNSPHTFLAMAAWAHYLIWFWFQTLAWCLACLPIHLLVAPTTCWFSASSAPHLLVARLARGEESGASIKLISESSIATFALQIGLGYTLLRISMEPGSRGYRRFRQWLTS